MALYVLFENENTFLFLYFIWLLLNLQMCQIILLDPVVESPDLGDFFSQWHKGRERNPAASLGCFSASGPSMSISQHYSLFSLETESYNEPTNIISSDPNITTEECRENLKHIHTTIHLFPFYTKIKTSILLHSPLVR